MKKAVPFTRENIGFALANALRDQSDTHERDDEAVIRGFFRNLGRESWIEMAICDYASACSVIEGSGE